MAAFKVRVSKTVVHGSVKWCVWDESNGSLLEELNAT